MGQTKSGIVATLFLLIATVLLGQGADTYESFYDQQSADGEKRGGGRNFMTEAVEYKRGGGRAFSIGDKRGGGRLFAIDEQGVKRGGGRAFQFAGDKRGGARAFVPEELEYKRAGGRAFQFAGDKRGGARAFVPEELEYKRGGGRTFQFAGDKRAGGRGFQTSDGDWKRGGARSFSSPYGDEKRAGARPFYGWKRGGARYFADPGNGFYKRAGARYFNQGLKRAGARAFHERPLGNGFESEAVAMKKAAVDGDEGHIPSYPPARRENFAATPLVGSPEFAYGEASPGGALGFGDNDSGWDEKRAGARTFPITDEAKEKRRMMPISEAQL